MQRNKPTADDVSPDAPKRVIKKYPNRRLYDTVTSAYITLSELKILVMQGLPFVVVDAKSGNDLTRGVLLQIILDEEAGGSPMFTEEVLESLIRFYGHAMQGFMGSYLEKNVQAFTEIQARLAEHSSGLSPEIWAQFLARQSPAMNGIMGTYLEQSRATLAHIGEQMQNQTGQMFGAFVAKR